MARKKYGTGRQAIIDATADLLRDGKQVRLPDIAKAAGVSRTLIYRHFPDGGKDELVAEAFAQIFRGEVTSDVDIIGTWNADRADLRDRIIELNRQILSEQRLDIRWSRVEALAVMRSNPYVSTLMRTAQDEMIEMLTATLMGKSTWGHSEEQLRSFATITLSIPLGLTAMLPLDATDADIDRLAETWADISLAWLIR